MIRLLILIAVGFALGRMTERCPLRWLPQAIACVVWLLLFLLGMEVGTDQRIAEGMAVLGLQGLVIALAATGGSCVAAWLLWKSVPKAVGADTAGAPAPSGSPGQDADTRKALRTGGMTGTFFMAGIMAGRFGGLDPAAAGVDPGALALGLLILLVGVSMGHDLTLFRSLASLDRRVLFLPLLTIAGSLAGCLVLWMFFPGRHLADVLAVGSGFGYYSLSSFFITDLRGAQLGLVALLANVARELITLAGAPLLLRLWGPLAPIAAGGATSMDTTLPVITAAAGPEYGVVAVYHGFIVDFSVPFLVTLFCSL